MKRERYRTLIDPWTWFCKRFGPLVMYSMYVYDFTTFLVVRQSFLVFGLKRSPNGRETIEKAQGKFMQMVKNGKRQNAVTLDNE